MRYLHLIPYTVFWVVLLMISCTPSPQRVALDRAESIIDTCPDSVLVILDSINNAFVEDKDKMLMSLLRLQANDRLYHVPSSDSTIKVLLKYYIEEGHERRLHPVVLYYAGRVYCELNQAPLALEYFKKSLSLTNEEDIDLRSRIHAQMAGIFLHNHMYLHAINHVKKELELEGCGDDTVRVINTKLLLSFSYSIAGYTDSARMVYDDIEKMMPLIHDSITQAVYASQKANFLLETGNPEEAKALLSTTPSVDDKASWLSRSLIRNKVDWENNNTDSIRNHSLELLTSSDMHARRQALVKLARISLNEGNVAEAASFTERLIVVSDSIALKDSRMFVAEVEKMLGFSELENRNSRLEAENLERLYSLISISVIALLMVIIFMIKISKKREESKILSQKLAIAQHNMAATTDRMSREIVQLRNEKGSLENDIRQSEKERTVMQKVGLSEITEVFMSESSGKRCGITQDHFSILEASLLVNRPEAMAFLLGQNLSQRNYRDSMMILIGLPLKSCALILNTSESSLSNSRRRLFRKLDDNKGCSGWSEFLNKM